MRQNAPATAFAVGDFVQQQERILATYLGTGGADPINGTSLNDTIFGFAGNDTLFGLGGNDSIDGGENEDFIDGGDGIDTLLGGDGNDSLAGGAGDDFITGGAGFDYALYDLAPSAVNVSLVSNTSSGGDGNDVLSGIEGIFGSPFNDTLTGNDFANNLSGGDGADLITGLGGSDYIEGNAGNDTLLGGEGEDFIYGGVGNDSLDGGAGVIDAALYSGNRSLYTVTMQDGKLIVSSTAEGTDTLSGIEHLTFADSFSVNTTGGYGLAAVELVAALFGNAGLGDAALVGQYLALLEGGLTLEEAADSAVASDRFATAAGTHSNSDFVNLVYRNIAGFNPDVGTHDTLTHLLDTSYYTQGQLGAIAAGVRGGTGFIAEVTAPAVSIIGDSSAANGALNGTGGVDYIFGRGGNDVINGLAGSDVINGGNGIDRAVYAGTKATYTIAVSDVGLSVRENATADKDVLESVERLTFANISVAYDLGGNAGVAAKVVGAMFGVAALQDEALVGQYLAMLDAGTTYEAAVAAAAASTRFGAEAGGHSNTQFVDHVIFNLVGIHPSVQVAQPYIDLLQTPGYSQGYLGMLAADTVYNLANVDLTGLAQSGLEYTLS